MKKIILVFLLALSSPAIAQMQNFCDEIERLRIWAGGSDTYGIWIEYQTNPQACPGGFFIQHSASNKSHVLSFLLAEKAQSNAVCIQAVTSDMNGSRCRLNQAYNP